MTILASRYEEFIAHAIDQTFTSTRPPVYEVTVAQAREHLREVETVMPFGNGNTASRLQIDGLITSIRPLVRKDDGVVWCYIIHLSERDDPADFIEVKVMARDLSTEAHNMFLAISGKQIHLPSIIEFEAFDGFRAGFSTRGEFRVATTIRSEESVRKSLGSWLDLNRTSESGSFAHVSIKQDEIKTKLEEADAARGKTQVAAESGKTIEKKPDDPRPTSDRHEGPGTDNRGGSAGSLSDVLTGDAPEKLDIAEDEIISGSTKDDIAMISNFVLRTTSDARPYKVTCVVDHDDSLPAGTFLLKRPAKNEVISLIGEDGIDIVTAAHGGRWSPELKGYIIAAGAVSTLKPCPSGLYHFIFTKRAILAAAAVDEHNKTIIAVKSDAEPFRVPFLRPAKTPFGFQYADVRCFLTRDVSLCYNDMGTGKTFEAAMWGATHIAASSLNLNLRSVVLDKAISSLAPLVDDKIKPDGDMADLFSGGSTRPILVATMASIANQFAGEIESFLTLKAKVLSTEDINLLIEAAGVRMPKKGQTMPQLKEAPEKLIKAFRKDVIGGHGFIVATYDCLSRHPWVVSAFDWSGVICDEAHELKGSNTHKTRAVFGDKIDRAPLLRDGRYIPILAMSGTFPKNRPGDWFVWTRLTEADGGVYTAGSLSDAQRRFDRRFDGLTYKEIWLRRGGGPARKVIVPDKGTPEHGDELKAILAPYLVRRLKDEINDLPPMRLQVRRTPSDGLYLDILMNIRTGKPLSQSSKDLLRRHDLLAANDTFKGEDPEDLDGKPSIAAASLAGKLAMVSALDKASGITSTLDSLGWIGGPTKDEPFVVIVFHRSALREVSRQLEMRGITHFTMSQDDAIEEREAKKTAFQSGERQAFVTTYGVGGTGLNLTRAARLLCAHLPWTDTALAQARDRIFRIGQTRPTSVVVLLLAASIDESTYYLIKHKGRANFKTASVDKMRTKGTSLPAWATGSVLDYDVRRSGDQEASKDETEKDPDDKPKSGWLS
jgi:superfamily II DNA or RNA helicase